MNQSAKSSQLLELEEKRVVREYRATLKEKKNTKLISITKRVTVAFVIINAILQTSEYFIKQPDLDQIYSHFESNDSMIHRNIALLDIQFYARKLELIAK